MCQLINIMFKMHLEMHNFPPISPYLQSNFTVIVLLIVLYFFKDFIVSNNNNLYDLKPKYLMKCFWPNRAALQNKQNKQTWSS